MVLFAVNVLLTMCIQMETKARINIRSNPCQCIEYYDPVLEDCFPCGPPCSRCSVADCHLQCPKYYRKFVPKTGHATDSGKDNLPTASDEEETNPEYYRERTNTVILISMVAVTCPIVIALTIAQGHAMWMRCQSAKKHSSDESGHPIELSNLNESNNTNEPSHLDESSQTNEPDHSTGLCIHAETRDQIEPYTTLATVSAALEVPVLSLLQPSTDEMTPEIPACNHLPSVCIYNPHCHNYHPHSFRDTDHETPLKQVSHSADIDHEETANQQHQRVQDIHPLVLTINPVCPVEQPPDMISLHGNNSMNHNLGNPEARDTEHNSTASCGESSLNRSRDTPVSRGAEIYPTSNDESGVNCNYDDPVTTDRDQSLLDHDDHQPSSAISTSATEPSTISLHEDPPGIRGMIGILHLRNFHNMTGHVPYNHESISLNHGSSNGSSFSMPSSAGVQRSLNEEQDYAYVQQNVREARSLHLPDDTENRYLHTRVYT